MAERHTYGFASQRNQHLHLHPDDAEPLGIGTGDRVRVSSRVHALECTAEVSKDPLVGVAILDHGWGSRLFDPQNQRLPNLMVQIGMHL